MAIIQTTNEESSSRATTVLTSLEPDQLSGSKRHFARRSLKGSQVLLLWALRFYVLFMIAVVLYQLWSGVH